MLRFAVPALVAGLLLAPPLDARQNDDGVETLFANDPLDGWQTISLGSPTERGGSATAC